VSVRTSVNEDVDLRAILMEAVVAEGRAILEPLARTLEDRDLTDPSLVVAHAIALLATTSATDPVLRLVLGAGPDALSRDDPRVAFVVEELMSAYWTIVLRKLDDRDVGHEDRSRTLRWLTFVHFVTVTSLVGDRDPDVNAALCDVAAALREHAARPLFKP
jgi:hypothetical protein